jgi:hypothetical protein
VSPSSQYARVKRECIRIHRAPIINGMSASPSHQSSFGQAEASSSRASNAKQPTVDDDHSDEEAALADDALDDHLAEQYVSNPEIHPQSPSTAHRYAEYPSSANPGRPLALSASRASYPLHLPRPVALLLSHARPTPVCNSSVMARAAQTTLRNVFSTTSTRPATLASACRTPKMRRGWIGTSKGLGVA